MKVTADNKKRVVLPKANPGDVFSLEEQDANHFLLVRLTPPAEPAKKTRKQVLKELEESDLHFDMTYDELAQWTREP